MSKIESLLSLKNSNDIQLNRVKEAMRKYIASPWDAIDKVIMDMVSYQNMMKNAKNKKIKMNSLCKDKFNEDDPSYKYQQKLCQSHSGNLLEHSQWSALQILKWNIDKDEIMNGVDLETAVVSAFFHDIGKGGDCVSTCTDKICWFDMYSSKKYDGKGEVEHTSYSGDIILGKKMFKINCGDCQSNCNINIRELIENNFPNVSIDEIALAAYMHWEFGKLNIPGKSDEEKIIVYFNAFRESCKKCNLIPNEELLQLCIAVSCSDITAGSNRRLIPAVSGIKPADEKFLGKDPWTLFGMDKKYLGYRNMLLKAFKDVQFYSLFL